MKRRMHAQRGLICNFYFYRRDIADKKKNFYVSAEEKKTVSKLPKFLLLRRSEWLVAFSGRCQLANVLLASRKKNKNGRTM